MSSTISAARTLPGPGGGGSIAVSALQLSTLFSEAPGFRQLVSDLGIGNFQNLASLTNEVGDELATLPKREGHSPAAGLGFGMTEGGVGSMTPC